MHNTSLGQTKRADGVLHRGRYSEEDRGGEGPGSPGGPAAEVQGAGSGRRRKSQPDPRPDQAQFRPHRRKDAAPTLQDHGSATPGIL